MGVSTTSHVNRGVPAYLIVPASRDISGYVLGNALKNNETSGGVETRGVEDVTARLMETWAHGQEVHDHLGVQRSDTDRIRNIAQLGVNTFGWTFRNRGMEPPGATPRVALLAPSGAIWEWNGDNATDCIQGSASEFCQVVTQTRNIGDTGLRVSGAVAGQWMAIAQCFAGRPEQPPAIGTRHTSKIS